MIYCVQREHTNGNKNVPEREKRYGVSFVYSWGDKIKGKS